MFVDQEGLDPNFSATATVTDDHALVTVSGEVDMATADAMFRAATKDDAAAATLDLRGVTFFDSAAIHALLQLAEFYGDRLRVMPSRQVRRVLEISGLTAQPWLIAEGLTEG
jgi:anti-anti-sigma factor